MADVAWLPDRREIATLAADALSRLDRTDQGPGASGRRDVVREVAERLAALAADQSRPDDQRRVLLGWRDRLCSFLLAAEALDELDVHADAADAFLRRGLVELLGELLGDASTRQLAPG